MSKERLEEIREHEIIADNEWGEYERHKVDFYYEHVGWLIKQAEILEKARKELDRDASMSYIFHKIEQLLDGEHNE